LYWRITRNYNAKAGDIAGSLNKINGYVEVSIDGKAYYAHRLIWLIMTGAMPCDQIDHIDHNPNNNRWENLREATHQENSKNMSMPVNNTSGHVGVSQLYDSDRYQAYIDIDGKRKSLGLFDSFNDAVAARRAAQEKAGYHGNHGTGD